MLVFHCFWTSCIYIYITFHSSVYWKKHPDPRNSKIILNNSNMRCVVKVVIFYFLDQLMFVGAARSPIAVFTTWSKDVATSNHLISAPPKSLSKGILSSNSMVHTKKPINTFNLCQACYMCIQTDYTDLKRKLALHWIDN